MRPHDSWRLRRRPSDRLWWMLVLGAGAVVLVLLLLRSLSSSGAEEPLAVSDGCPPAGCAAPATTVCPEGDECPSPAMSEVLAATPECPQGDCPPPATPECPIASDCLPLEEANSFGDTALLPGDEFLAASDVQPPDITGQAAAVLERSCGALLYGHNAQQRMAPASLTKIVTALVAIEQAELSEIVAVRVNGALLAESTKSSVMGLEPGQQLSLRDLLYGLLMASGNDAAIAIARHVGGNVPGFVELMNEKVAELRLPNTRFANPHGLDEEGLYTSAFDIAVLGRELLAQPLLANIVATRTYEPDWDGPPLWNGNKLLYDYPGAVGVKTGYTVDAGQTLVAAAERDGRTVIVSVLGSWDRYADATALLEWAFANTTSPCAA